MAQGGPQQEEVQQKKRQMAGVPGEKKKEFKRVKVKENTNGKCARET